MNKTFMACRLLLIVLPMLAACDDGRRIKDVIWETSVDQDGLYFINTALQSGGKEIAAAQLAARQASDPRVRNFAAMMLRDHRKQALQLLHLCEDRLVTPSPGLLPEDKRALDSLTSLTGKVFDQAYIEQMVIDHEKAVAVFKQGNADRTSIVHAYAGQQLPMLNMHLQAARQIIAALSKINL